MSAFDPALVLTAMQVMGMVTLTMMALGTASPRFFASISGALDISLLVAIVVQLVDTFVFRADLGVLDWIVALIFCGYIGLDWGRANQIPKTLDNAVDSAAALYMDNINLFIRILSILGRSDD